MHRQRQAFAALASFAALVVTPCAARADAHGRHVANAKSEVARSAVSVASADAQQLQKFEASAQEILKATQQSVDKRLNDLDEKANHLFDEEVAAATAAMKNVTEERIRRYKLDRETSSFPIQSSKDAVFGLPAEVDRIYDSGRYQFELELKSIAVRVAQLVDREIIAAHADIRAAEEKIATEQAKLPASLRARAARRQADYVVKLAALESGGRASTL